MAQNPEIASNPAASENQESWESTEKEFWEGTRRSLRLAGDDFREIARKPFRASNLLRLLRVAASMTVTGFGLTALGLGKGIKGLQSLGTKQGFDDIRQGARQDTAELMDNLKDPGPGRLMKLVRGQGVFAAVSMGAGAAVGLATGSLPLAVVAWMGAGAVATGVKYRGLQQQERKARSDRQVCRNWLDTADARARARERHSSGRYNENQNETSSSRNSVRNMRESASHSRPLVDAGSW